MKLYVQKFPLIHLYFSVKDKDNKKYFRIKLSGWNGWAGTWLI